MKALAAAVPNVDNAAVKAIPRTYTVHNSIPPHPPQKNLYVCPRITLIPSNDSKSHPI